MAGKPTFYLADDFVALMELKPAERTVYGLLRCNASFGRNGVADHTVHVTAGWFTEMTAHWENPLPASTARRALNGLIDKGVLIRLNEPQDGSGFLLAFVADPRGQLQGPVNGFEQAKKVAKRCGVRAYYERRDEMPGNPAVTGIRLLPPKRHWKSGDPDLVPPVAPKAEYDGPEEAFPEDAPEPDVQDGGPEPNFDEPEPQGPPVTDQMREFARALEERTSQMADPKLRLMSGACQRLAEEYRTALEQGWIPRVLANRLASELNPRIKLPERLLASKAGDIGAPPAQGPVENVSVDPSALDGVREAEVRRQRQPEGEPDLADEVEKGLIAKQYRERKAKRAMAGRKLPGKP
jgi:hypothetical protein